MMTVDDEGMAMAMPGAVANGIGEMRMTFFERVMDMLDLIRIMGRPQACRSG